MVVTTRNWRNLWKCIIKSTISVCIWNLYM